MPILGAHAEALAPWPLLPCRLPEAVAQGWIAPERHAPAYKVQAVERPICATASPHPHAAVRRRCRRSQGDHVAPLDAFHDSCHACHTPAAGALGCLTWPAQGLRATRPAHEMRHHAFG